MFSGTDASTLPPAFQSLIGIAMGFFAIRGARRSYADPEWGRNNTLLPMSDRLSLKMVRKLSVIGVFIGFLFVLAGLFVGLEAFVPDLSKYHGTSLAAAISILALAATGLLLSRTRHRKVDGCKS
jgi:hypothetical protein